MTRIDDIAAIMESIAPAALAAEWDNCGTQLDAGNADIKKALVALEISGGVVAEAKAIAADLIITHHPLIFGPLYNVDAKTAVGGYISELIKSGISVFSAHTNFDEADGGNNDYIAELLGLTNIEKFGGGAMGVTGELPGEMSFEYVCGYVKERLKLSYMKASGESSEKIRKVGVCAGSGSDITPAAAAAGCGLFITGDIKYHDARYARETGLCLIDAGHYGTEKFFAENLSAKLDAAFGGRIEVVMSSVNLEPFYMV